MVCRECRRPLNLYSLVNPADEREAVAIAYLHAQEYIGAGGEVCQVGEGYDHAAVPVEGSPLEASAIVPRRPIRVPDLETGGERDYSSPWNCCTGCLPSVRARDITRMLNRVMSSEYNGAAAQPEFARAILRAEVRKLYTLYLSSAPQGPYAVKVRAAPAPTGKRGSLRGMGRRPPSLELGDLRHSQAGPAGRPRRQALTVICTRLGERDRGTRAGLP
jgi:hypothetical protein